MAEMTHKSTQLNLNEYKNITLSMYLLYFLHFVFYSFSSFFQDFFRFFFTAFCLSWFTLTFAFDVC